MNNLIAQHIHTIHSICKTHHIKELYLFGNQARGDDKPSSDVDFLVVFDKKAGTASQEFEHWLTVQQEPKQLLKRDIDLIMSETLQNKYLNYFINK
jgi:predicted nucleotidyltransferase